MITKTAYAAWKGTTAKGQGVVRLGKDGQEKMYSMDSRFGQGSGRSPEEMIGGALAACFSMALTRNLEQQGAECEGVETTADVQLEVQDNPRVARVVLQTRGYVPSVSKSDFEHLAEQTAQTCPVAKALSGADITVQAELVN